LLAGLAQPSRRAVVADNLTHVLGPQATPAEVQRAVWRAFAEYGRYWADVARLDPVSGPDGRPAILIEGEDILRRALAAGSGAVFALPHLGCWEVGGRWIAAEGFPLTTVVEPLRPRELFDWFVAAREAIGIRVLELGPGVAAELLSTLRRGAPIALVADRDLTGDGVEVEFFGERTTLPAGPAVLSLRSGAPLLPCAVFHRAGGGHTAVVLPPLDTTRRERLAGDVARVTQALAVQLEALIRRAPSQWHVFQPRWTGLPPAAPGVPTPAPAESRA
jgi:KDO2-lipid IV(A) lauroyltransferase